MWLCCLLDVARLPLQSSVDWFCVIAVVFGKVVEGMALVRKAEATGTQSGKPRQPVLIADSGEVCMYLVHAVLRPLWSWLSLLLELCHLISVLFTADQP